MDTRRHARIPYKDRIRLSWQDSRGDMKYAEAKCLDISQHGVAVELVEPIPMSSYVSVRSDRLKLAGSAAVRYCRRKSGKYSVGLEFVAGMQCRALPSPA